MVLATELHIFPPFRISAKAYHNRIDDSARQLQQMIIKPVEK